MVASTGDSSTRRERQLSYILSCFAVGNTYRKTVRGDVILILSHYTVFSVFLCSGSASSQGVVVDRTIYISGQLGMDPTSGQLVAGGVQAQTKQVRLWSHHYEIAAYMNNNTKIR